MRANAFAIYNAQMDFKALMADILGGGLSQREAAAILQCSQTHISDLLNGTRKEPGYALGMRIVKLHRKCSRTKRS